MTSLLPVVETPGAEGPLLLIKLILWIGGGIILYLAFRLLLKRLRPEGAATLHGDKDDENSTPWITTVQGIVHQLKQKEIELTQMNENILQSVTSGVVSFNRNGQVTTLNPAAEAILGVQRETMIGADCKTLFGSQTPLPASLAEILSRKKDLVREEYEFRSQTWLGMTASALRDSQGALMGALFVFVDLTQIKALQAEVELKKRFEMMGEISAWIAHEFRNDMGTIMGYASLLSKDLIPNTPQHDMTRAIIHECVTMEQLIADLLAYGKKPSLTLEQTDLAPLIEEVLKPFRSQTPHVQFVIRLVSCMAAVDPILIRQVFSNLIQNGIEAMREVGTFTLQLTAENAITIKITDTGRGIPKNQRDKIFLPFFTTREKGSGLGLAFSRKIVLAHQGTLTVESEEGVGTTFTLTLPRPPVLENDGNDSHC